MLGESYLEPCLTRSNATTTRRAGADPALRDGPVFAAPWEAQAFAMTLRLHEQGAFSWKEWAQTLSAVIREAQAGGDPDDGATLLHALAPPH